MQNEDLKLAEQAVAEAQEATLAAIRAGQPVYDDFWVNFDLNAVDLESLGSVELDLKGIYTAIEAGKEDGVGLSELLVNRAYLSIGHAVTKTDAKCIAASKLISDAQERLRTAEAALETKKQELKAK